MKELDSQNIYLAFHHMESRMAWAKATESEWGYIGDGTDFRVAQAQKLISSKISGDFVYIVIDRHNAFRGPKGEAAARVKELLPKNHVNVCSLDFKHIVHFNHIGVVKCGSYDT